MYDHFHVQYEFEDRDYEIEGGFTAYPKGWENLSWENRRLWWHDQAVAWGMPPAATIKRLWLAR